MPTEVVIPKSVYHVISEWADKAYPNEGIGLLIGTMKGGNKTVVRFAPLTNIILGKTVAQLSSQEDARFSTLPDFRKHENSGKKEFAMDPQEFNRETLKAEKENLDVIGVVHTHPDHPPRPSETDASQPFLAQWSNIIVSVQMGKTKEMKSWFRDSDDQPFTEETIRTI
jgi:proteasome lid subunit RPN8/RPN11